MEAVKVLAEIESMSKADRNPNALSIDKVQSGKGVVKSRELFGKHKFITGKNLTPKQLNKNLKSMHDLHRAAADAHRDRASEIEKGMPKSQPSRGSKDLNFHQSRVDFHTKKADKLKDKLLAAK
jgi:hypothetical protein